MKDSVIYSVGVSNDATAALSMMGRMKTKFNYNIYTNLERPEQMIVETIGMKNYKYQFPLSKMNWKIEDEVKKNRNLQLPESNIGNRWSEMDSMVHTGCSIKFRPI